MYFASSSFAPMHMMNNSKVRKKRFLDLNKMVNRLHAQTLAMGLVLKPVFTRKLKPVYYMFTFHSQDQWLSKLAGITSNISETCRFTILLTGSMWSSPEFPSSEPQQLPMVGIISASVMGLIEIFASIWWHIKLLRHFLARAPWLLCNITHFYHQEMNIT